MKVKKTCVQCGRKFETLYRKPYRERKTCSKECQYKLMSENNMYPEYMRGKTWEQIHGLKRGRTLRAGHKKLYLEGRLTPPSQRGKYKRFRLQKRCLICKKEFTWINSQDHHRGNFCSIDCRNKGMSLFMNSENARKKRVKTRQERNTPELRERQSRIMKELFSKDGFLFRYFSGLYKRDCKISRLTEVDKSIINANVLLFKIRREQNVRKQETRGSRQPKL